MARGFSHKEGMDNEEAFAPIARYNSFRSMDVKTAFLNGVVEEEVYVEQSLGFETHDRESHVCILKKVLYDLKQARRTWLR